MLDNIRLETRYAVRGLSRSPVFTAVAVLSLALGIGATTAAFSVLDALLFRPLPFQDAGRLVDVYEHHPVEVCEGCGVGTSFENYRELGAAAKSFDGMAAYRSDYFTLFVGDGAERWNGAYASASLFPLLGIDPLYGRMYSDAEDAPGAAERVVLISERLWRERFEGSGNVVGRALRVNGTLHTIVGVMPAEMAFPSFAELWTPLAPAAASEPRSDRSVGVVARLGDGVSRETAAAEMEAWAARNASAYPAANEGWTSHVEPLRSEMAADYTRSFVLVLGIVAFVLLVACANVGNLMLARASTRRAELAVRAALGASRTDLARGLLVESLLVSFTAGALGLLVAAWAIQGISLLPNALLPAWVRYSIDARMALFAFAVALFTGITFGPLPAFNAARVDVSRMLTEGARAGIGGRVSTRIRSTLVAVQVAAALVLAFGAWFMTGEFLRISNFDPGYSTERLYGGSITASGSAYAEPRAVAQLVGTLSERIPAAVGSNDVAFSSRHIINWPTRPHVDVRIETAAGAMVTDELGRVENITPAYFRTLGIPIRAGRDFTGADAAGAQPVAIIGESLAARIWPGESPLGRRISIGPDEPWATVVGVVPSYRASPFARDTARLLYLPLAQHAAAQPSQEMLSLHVRLPRDGSAIAQQVRAAVAAIDPDLVVDGLSSAEESQGRAAAGVRTVAFAAGALGIFAALLASMGIYGVIAFVVAHRTPELGIRIALGATRTGIVRLVLCRAVILAGIGLAFGTAGALALARVLRSQLPGTHGPGIGGLLLLLAAFMAIALLASWLPARRAGRIDPIRALRSD